MTEKEVNERIRSKIISWKSDNTPATTITLFIFAYCIYDVGFGVDAEIIAPTLIAGVSLGFLIGMRIVNNRAISFLRFLYGRHEDRS